MNGDADGRRRRRRVRGKGTGVMADGRRADAKAICN
jgi:hypothetical protein